MVLVFGSIKGVESVHTYMNATNSTKGQHMTTAYGDRSDKTTVDTIPGYAAYPKSDTHAWNAWAFLAIEAEGYNDFTVTDPYTGKRLHAYSWDGTDDPYQALRNLIDAMQRAGFLDAPKQD